MYIVTSCGEKLLIQDLQVKHVDDVKNIGNAIKMQGLYIHFTCAYQVSILQKLCRTATMQIRPQIMRQYPANTISVSIFNASLI